MRPLILSLTVAAGLFAGILSSNFGCGEADAAFDCNQVCTRYKECYDANYDISRCTSDCRTAARSDTAYKSKADQCEACIGDKSCISATFACSIPCGDIVP